MISQRIFAKLLPYASRHHERLVVDRKRALFSGIEPGSVVVEVGPGTGPNFRYYPRGIEWIGIEPNSYVSPALEAASSGFAARVLELRAEVLPLADASADAVVCTLVLCSVGDASRVLRESIRVLKPGGRFYFLEHVAAPAGTLKRFGQRIIDPLWKRCADGCETCRDTASRLRSAGFSRVDLEAFELPSLGLLSPHIAGIATK